MTKTEFAKTLISMVDNFRFVGDSETEIQKSIMNMLGELKPKDRERFAQWGYPNQQSTPEDCWISKENSPKEAQTKDSTLCACGFRHPLVAEFGACGKCMKSMI
ncbi:MAG: hypothetical protein COC06_07660 [Bacteroidales bacterium]|nr:MAG: hypothetical protein COC06_07660 [Bacteroidales bacterium]